MCAGEKRGQLRRPVNGYERRRQVGADAVQGAQAPRGRRACREGEGQEGASGAWAIVFARTSMNRCGSWRPATETWALAPTN